MSNKKQTAVEWLLNEISLTTILDKEDVKLFNQAKELEKQQQGYSEEDLKEAFSMGRTGKTIEEFNIKFKKK